MRDDLDHDNFIKSLNINVLLNLFLSDFCQDFPDLFYNYS